MDYKGTTSHGEYANTPFFIKIHLSAWGTKARLPSAAGAFFFNSDLQLMATLFDNLLKQF